MEKTVLIIHGWPQPITNRHFIYKYFIKKGYKVFTPYLFAQEFTLSEQNVLKYFKKILQKRKPDVIVGFSMGGFLLPRLGELYPQSKLIFVATGPQLKPKYTCFKSALFLLETPIGRLFLKITYSLPKKVLIFVYQLLNPFYGNETQKSAYIGDMKNNFKYIFSIPIGKQLEIVNFTRNIDNTPLLKKLKNKTLVFSGKQDIFMPIESGKMLKNYIKNSKLFINNESHFNVLTKFNLSIIDNFLEH